MKISNNYIGQYDKLTLNMDSTYLYTYHMGWQYFYSEGTWKLLKNNTLVLKDNYRDFDNLPVEIIESCDTNQKNTIIVVKTNSGNFHDVNKTLKYHIESFEGSTYIDTSNVLILPELFPKGLFRICVSRNDSNLVPFDRRNVISSKNLKLKNINSNNITVIFQVDEKAFSYDNANCDTLIVKLNKLYCLDKVHKLSNLKYTKAPRSDRPILYKK